jgi:hypothetical protein
MMRATTFLLVVSKQERINSLLEQGVVVLGAGNAVKNFAVFILTLLQE